MMLSERHRIETHTLRLSLTVRGETEEFRFLFPLCEISVDSEDEIRRFSSSPHFRLGPPATRSRPPTVTTEKPELGCLSCGRPIIRSILPTDHR